MITYSRLWLLLKRRGYSPRDIIHLAGISESTYRKMSRNEPVRMDVLERVCAALRVDVGDVYGFQDDGLIIMRRRIFMHHSIIYASQYNIIHLSNARWERAERTHISNINPQRRTHPLQHIHADSLVPRHFPIGGFADPGQVDDVAWAVSASL